MIVNGVELENLDIYDVEVAEKYERGLEKIKNMSEDVVDKSFSESIKIQCNHIFDFFNTLFGEGTDTKVFGNKVNLVTCLKAFEELISQVNEQRKEQDKEVEKISNKYSPNRAARRSKK